MPPKDRGNVQSMQGIACILDRGTIDADPDVNEPASNVMREVEPRPFGGLLLSRRGKGQEKH